MRRRVFRERDLFPPQVGHRFDVLSNHDAIAAVGPIDLLIDAGHHAAIAWLTRRIDKAIDKERQHVERGPANVDIAGGVGVAHLDGLSISTSSTWKSLPSGVFQVLPALKPLLAWMIGAQPAQTLRAKRTVLFWSGL